MSLAIITKEARLILKVGGAAATVVFLLFLIFQGGSFIQRTFFPTPPPPPEEKYGKLSPIKFPDQTSTIPEFKINTVSGALPIFPEQIRVYKLLKNSPTITALSQARKKAGSLGYRQNEREVVPNIYSWSNLSQNGFLVYNIISLNFSVNTDYLSRGDFISGELNDIQELNRTLKNFIETLDGDTTDIDFSRNSYSYYISSDNSLVRIPSQSNAMFVKIFLYQNPVDNLKIYYPTKDPTGLYFTIGNNGSLTVVEANYNHFTPNLKESSTYPIKTSDQAFDDLKNGKSYIVNSSSNDLVDVTDMSLGYYLSDDQDQNLLMPIFIFSGKDNFLAYVSAISN